MSIGIRRREFIAVLGGAAATWPLVGRAQQPAMPLVGFVNGASADVSTDRERAFRQGLGEAGYVGGQNVTVEYYRLDGRYDGAPALMTDLVKARDGTRISLVGMEACAMASLCHGALLGSTNSAVYWQSGDYRIRQ